MYSKITFGEYKSMETNLLFKLLLANIKPRKPLYYEKVNMMQ